MSRKTKRRWNLLTFAMTMLFVIIYVSVPIGAADLLVDGQAISSAEVDYNDPDVMNAVAELGLDEKLANDEVVLKVVEVESNFERHAIVGATDEQLSDVAPMALSPIDVKLILAYDKTVNVLHVVLTIKAADLLKYATAAFETTGPMGNSGKVIHVDNFIPSPVMTLNWSYSGINSPLYPQGQFVKVTGTVKGIFGSGSFGPTTSGVLVG